MDFFRAVFSEDPPPPPSPDAADRDPDHSPSSPSNPQSDSPNSTPKFPAVANSWASFGSSFLKTVTTKSESVLESYRRDLKEFSFDLRKETAIIREAAGRAVRDLPGRLESGAAVAQTSLESVGQVIDNLGGAVSEIIINGKDSIFNTKDDDSDGELEETGNNSSSDNPNVKPYSRLDTAIRAIQCDIRTYCEEPEDSEEFSEMKKGFSLENLDGEIEDLIKENGAISEIYEEVVPGKVDRETFWSRYFYRAHRVKKAEEARMKLVKRAIEGEEEEELSWDFDDEEDDENIVIISSKELKKGVVEENEKEVEDPQLDHKEKLDVSKLSSEAEDGAEQGVLEGMPEENDSNGEKLESKSDDRGSSEGRNGNVSDFSVISSQPSEVDAGWDDVEEGVGSGDETKLAAQGTEQHTVDLRKRLGAAEEDDLTWDVQDDDEPAKS